MAVLLVAGSTAPEVFLHLAAAVLATTFLVAGAIKFVYRAHFNSVVDSWAIPPKLAMVMKSFMASTEVVLGLAFPVERVVSGSYIYSFTGSLVVLAVFSGGQLWLRRRKIEARCGCFVSDSRVAGGTIIRSVFLASFAAAGMLLA